MSDSQKPRTRFAPSPTGFLHVGAARTALFAWLLARRQGGDFILRIEDTDKVREVEGSIKHIEDSLKWLGLNWDEGITVGGPYEPYIQSERLDIYKEWAQRLIDAGRAYVDPYTKEELDALRQKAKDGKRAFLFRDHRPADLSAIKWDGSQPLRFKSEPKAYRWTDAVMGELSAGTEAVDDFILMKADGFPTYNFCHIVDDAVMGVTHVLRSQEFISSTPKFLNLYEALGLERPALATLPFVMAIDGKKKLSKRDGAKDLLDYAAEGYLPEALINFLATLGWNDGTEQEVYTTKEIIEQFDISRIQRSPARFDEQRLLWLNGQHIRMLNLDELAKRAETFWPASATDAPEDLKRQVLGLVQDRLKTLSDLEILTNYFFAEPEINWEMVSQSKPLVNLSEQEAIDLLAAAAEKLTGTEFTDDALQIALNELLEATSRTPAVLFSLIRLAISWAPFSPALNQTLAVLGREKVLKRLQAVISYLDK